MSKPDQQGKFAAGGGHASSQTCSAKLEPIIPPSGIGDRPLSLLACPSMLEMNIGIPIPPSLWIITCMSAYIWARLAVSVSPRAATSSWSNFSFFQAASFQGASDLKNSVNAKSALGRALTLPKPTGCFIQCVDQ